MVVSEAKLGEIVGVSRQAVNKAVKEGFLTKTDTGIDLNSPSVEVWAMSTPGKAEMWLRWKNRGAKKAKTSSNDKKTAKTSPKTAKSEVKTEENHPKNVDFTHEPALSPAETSLRTAATRLKYEQERVIKLMQENAALRNESIFRDQFKRIEERAINYLITSLKNTGNVMCMDLEKKILANSGLSNSDFFDVEDRLMSVVNGLIEFKKSELKNIGIVE